jgi:DNA-binding XRE family transcriptional regulator
MTGNDPKSLITIARANGDEREAEPLDLGARVRELRKARDWTLEHAANQAGLARSTLSKIENGQITPPQRDQVNGRMTVTKLNEGSAQATATYEHELLAEGLRRKQMLPYRARVRARSMEEFDGWVRHDGEEFMYVLTGVVTLFTEFYEPVEMRRGDSAYYDAAMGHNVVSQSQEDATILWVTSLS